MLTSNLVYIGLVLFIGGLFYEAIRHPRRYFGGNPDPMEAIVFYVIFGAIFFASLMCLITQTPLFPAEEPKTKTEEVIGVLKSFLD